MRDNITRVENSLLTNSEFCSRIERSVKKEAVHFSLISTREKGVVSMGSRSNLGSLIVDGESFSLDGIIGNMRRGLIVNKDLRSQGFRTVPTRARIRFMPTRLNIKPSRVDVFSYEEIILAEIRLLATNKPMIIIGVILILIGLGNRFFEIGPVELHELVVQVQREKKISLFDVKRVLEKVSGSDLFLGLAKKKKMSLAEAYALYRQ